MSLAHETGAGLAGAESYCSVAFADARHSAFGNTAWDGSATVKEAALRRATAFMLGAYRDRWQGVRVTSTQALDWPRAWVVVDGFSVASDIVPAEVANACADLAIKALAGELNADLERAIIREKVGPIETEYSPYSPQAKRYRSIEMALAPYLTGSGAMARLVRT